MHYAPKRRVRAHARCREKHRAFAVYCAGVYLIADFLINGHAFAGKHGLVHACAAGYNGAVHAHPLAGLKHHRVAHHNVLGAQFNLRAVAHNAGRVRRKAHQLFDSVPRAPLGQRFQIFAELYQHYYHACRFKIERMHGVHIPIGDFYNTVYAVKRCGKRAYGYERIHVGAFEPQRLEPAPVKPPARDKYGYYQYQLRQRIVERIIFRVYKAGQRMLKPLYHRRHGNIEKRNTEHRREYEPPLHVPLFVGLFCGHLGLGLLRQVEWIIPRVLNGLLQRRLVRNIFVIHYVCAFRGQINACAFHAANALQRAFHPRGACRAAHSAHAQFKPFHSVLLFGLKSLYMALSALFRFCIQNYSATSFRIQAVEGNWFD